MISVRGLYFMLVVLEICLLVNSKSKNVHLNDNPISNTRQSNVTAKQHDKSTKDSKNVRKSRSPQFNTAFTGLGRPQIGLGQLGLPYSPRYTNLALQGTPTLQALGQNRNLLLSNNALLGNNAGYRLPYNYQLARLLSTINLLRERSAIASAVSPEVLAGLYTKPKRLKYNSIPIKPVDINNGFAANPLSLLLGRSSVSANQAESSDDDDDDDYEDNNSGGFCSPNPCHNNGRCKNRIYGFKCVCINGFTGKHCTGRSPCQPNPCQYDGQCIVSGRSFDCSCTPGRKGERCEVEDRCHPTPCMNGGTCTELSEGHECTCIHGYRGKNCEVRSTSGSCSTNLCQNGGQCIETRSGFECICKPGYSGTLCSALENKCLVNPCRNGGRCLQRTSGAGYICDCPLGYRGDICEEISLCQPSTCRNGGSCFASDNGYKCVCVQGFSGKNCEVHRSCQADTCHNGAKCIEHEHGFKCVCPAGYKGLYCEDADQCRPNPCLNNGECVELEGDFKCRCQGHYHGIRCEDIDLCGTNPCMNGGRCVSYNGGFKCICSRGFLGDTCREKSSCEPNPCHNGGQCTQDAGTFKCSCNKGYVGKHCEVVDNCMSNPCQHGATCKNIDGGFSCSCPSDYKGKYCQEKDPCLPNPCVNKGKCLSTSDGFICRCSLGFKGETCSDEDPCQPNPCINSGRCISRDAREGFDCECTEGFKGTICKEKDPCHPNPCSNLGMCTAIGGGITCNCTQGYKGSTCEDLDKCHPNPCRHGGVCEEVVGARGFVCQCPQSYKGINCEVKDRCHPNPCQHDGYCLEINNDVGFLCNCSSGFRGAHCQDRDPCHPNPCHNSGSCLHTYDGGFACNCSLGFKGQHCQDKNLCRPNPCQFGDKCQQTGSDSYQCVKNLCHPDPCEHGGRCIAVNDDDFQCVCSNKYSGKTCHVLSENGDDRQHVPENDNSKPDPCLSNPCQNGGTCQVLGNNGFSCTCKNGFSGTLCQTKASEPATVKAKDDFCSPSPCKNNGVCVQESQGYSCVCKSGFIGFHCQVDPCDSNPCSNNGKCIRDDKSDGGFRCRCLRGFVGKHCDENYCLPNPCSNDGLCVSIPNKGYQCKCRDGFTGDRCKRNPCSPNPCKNAGTCMVFYTVYLCKCPTDFRGTQCEVTLANKFGSKDVAVIRKAETSRPAVHVFPHKASSCKPNPCQNNAICLDTINGGYECFCRGEFSGPKCEDVGEYTYSSAPKFFPEKGEECKHCDRFAHCVGGHCICRDGFVGDGLDCWEEKLEDRLWTCDVNPCKNGGTCKPGIAKCVCRLGYIGKYCEAECFPSIHLSFDKVEVRTLLDDSGYNNNAIMINGAQIAPQSGKCNNAVNLLGGDILMDGPNFKNIPRTGITIATWIKLETRLGVQSIFSTVGSNHSQHTDGQYHLEIDNGRIRWFHRDEYHQTIFSVVSPPAMTEGAWAHLAATYSSSNKRARVFVNGDMIAEESGHGLLSTDWAGRAEIGKHQHEFGNRMLRGMVDEFFIFPGELPRLEILVLIRHCKVYFKHSKPNVVAQKSQTLFPYNKAAKPKQILTIKPYIQPARPQTRVQIQSPWIQEANERQSISDLEQILASFEGNDPAPSQHVSAIRPPNTIPRPWEAHRYYNGPNRLYGSVTAREKFPYQKYQPQLRTNTIKTVTPQNKWQIPMAKQNRFNQVLGNKLVDRTFYNRIPLQRSGVSGANFPPARMRSPLAYSVNPPLTPPRGRAASSSSRMSSPLTYNNRIPVPQRSTVYTNVAAPLTRSPNFNSLRRQQYLYSRYKKPPPLAAPKNVGMKSWAASTMYIAPKRYYGASYNPLKPQYHPGVGNVQRALSKTQPYKTMGYYGYYSRQFRNRPQRPVARTIPRLQQQVWHNTRVSSSSPLLLRYGGTNRRITTTPARTLQRDDTGNTFHSPDKYRYNFQARGKSSVSNGGDTKINPNDYIAFRLQPGQNSDGKSVYSDSLKQLNTQLTQLNKDHKVNFKPVQIKYVLKLLKKGLTEMEDKQITRRRQNIYRPLTVHDTSKRKNTILQPIYNRSNFYRLTYPDVMKASTSTKRARWPLKRNPYAYSRNYFPKILKRKKKNVHKIENLKQLRKKSLKRSKRKQKMKK